MGTIGSRLPGVDDAPALRYEPPMKLGFIGLGGMGRPMAQNLLKAGHELVVYNRTRARTEPFQEQGARVADTPAGASTEVDAVVTMLADDAAVEQAVLGEALSRGHPLPVGVGGAELARGDGAAADQDRARAAGALPAAQLGAGDAELIAQHGQQGRVAGLADGTMRS